MALFIYIYIYIYGHPWVSCYHALTITKSQNKKILSKIALIDLEVCKPQWLHEDHWKMSKARFGLGGKPTFGV